jgi:3-methylfumaryl-CoA hydratase
MADDWSAWTGREELREDHIDSEAVRRWLATFDRDAPEDGMVPQGFHWCLCLPDTLTASLGADGHPARTNDRPGLLPPVPLPRRMWAASQIEFLQPLHPGQAIVRRSRVAAIKEKQGSTGKLVFVELVHDIDADAVPHVRETQSLVFREAATGAVAKSGDDGSSFDPGAWDFHRVITPSTPLLFRYSALTFNSHRIHYDLPYAQQEEGYHGLVVHGPLTATLLLDLAARRFGDNRLRNFSFRGLAPAIAGEPLHLALRGSGDEIELAAINAQGQTIMTASAREGDSDPVGA